MYIYRIWSCKKKEKKIEDTIETMGNEKGNPEVRVSVWRFSLINFLSFYRK